MDDMDGIITFSSRNLRLAHSTQSPSSNVPRLIASDLAPDILLNIFFRLREIQSSWDWVALTRVCRNWRRVALECSSLWSTICAKNTCSPRRIRAFLERSKIVELTVDLEISHPKGDEILSVLEGHMWRVREFKIAVVGGDFQGVKARLLEMTQRAKLLALRYEWLPSYKMQPLTGIITDLPDIFPAIQLDSLSLDSVALPWSCSLYYGLTELSIADGDGLPVPPTIWQIIHILEHCPKLRRLSLQGIFAPDAFDEVDISEVEAHRLSLPLLERITLDDMPFSICEDLCTMFNFNTDAVLCLSIIGYPFDSPPALPSNVYIGRNECKSINVTFDEESFTIHSNYMLVDGRGDTSLSIHVPHGTHRVIAGCSAILKDPFWKTAEDVVVSFEDINPSDRCYHMQKIRWAVVFSGIPKLTRSLTLKLPPASHPGNRCSDGLGGILMLLDEPDPGIFWIQLPNLEQLKICNANFVSESNAGGDYYTLLVKHMEDRSKRIKRECRVCFVECMFKNDVPETIDLFFESV